MRGEIATFQENQLEILIRNNSARGAYSADSIYMTVRLEEILTAVNRKYF